MECLCCVNAFVMNLNETDTWETSCVQTPAIFEIPIGTQSLTAEKDRSCFVCLFLMKTKTLLEPSGRLRMGLSDLTDICQLTLKQGHRGDDEETIIDLVDNKSFWYIRMIVISVVISQRFPPGSARPQRSSAAGSPRHINLRHTIMPPAVLAATASEFQKCHYEPLFLQ